MLYRNVGNAKKAAGSGSRAVNGTGDNRSSNANLDTGARRNEKHGGKRHHAKGGHGGRGKRDYDRHDASGRGHETEKRHGGGKGNWGAEGEEAKDLNDKLVIEDESDAVVESEQEEEKQMSLEEYEAVMAEKKAALNATKESAFKVDDSQFAGMKTFAKQEEVVDLSLDKHAKVIGANKGPKDKDRKEISQILDVGFRVQSEEEKRATNRRGGDRRGGRGGDKRGGRGGDDRRGGRGGDDRRGGRGGGRGAARGGPSINVADTTAFPSLG